VRRVFLILLSLALGATGTRAATDTSEVSSVHTLTDSIIVTANRFGLTPERSVWPTVLIKRSELQGDGTLEEALDGRGGLDVRNQNGIGSLTTLSNWGVFNRHMLLLYNGRPVKDYSLGGFNLSDYSADEFQRIEILKGPQSAFYGSDAVGGVINLISSTALADRIEVSTRQGSYGLHTYEANVDKRIGQVGVGGYAEFTRADNGRDNAGSERYLFNLRGDYISPDNRHHVTASARYFNDSLGVPGPTPATDNIPAYGSAESYSTYNHQRDEDYSTDLQYRYDHSANGQFGLGLFWEKKKLDYYSLYNYQYDYFTFDSTITPVDSSLNHDSVDVYSTYLYDKRSSGMNVRYMNRIGGATVAGGLDWLSGSLNSGSHDRNLATNTSGPFAPYEYSYDSQNAWDASQRQVDLWSNVIWEAAGLWELDLSGRVQFVRNRRAQPSYNLGTILSPAADVRFKLGYAYAFRLPSIAEQFAEDFFTAGNRDLNPEVSHSIIASLDFGSSEGRSSASATFFHQFIDSLIQYQYQPTSGKSVPVNVNRFRTTGIDLKMSYRFVRELSLEWGGVYQKAKQTSASSNDFAKANYVPDLKWRLNIEGAHRKISYVFGLDFTDKRSLITEYYTKILRSVYELSASVSVRVVPDITLSLSGYDLTNQKRPDQFGFDQFDRDFPSPGRRFVINATIGLM
jgi:outer membrane cobalamin receptor